MAMITQELSRHNAGEVIYYIQYDDETKRVSMFGCLNQSEHDVRGTLLRPESRLIDAQIDFPPGGDSPSWVSIRNGMEMIEAPDEPGYFESPYSFNAGG